MHWVEPGKIRFKISPHDDLKGRAGGDWDVERRYPVEGSAKFRSIVERYSEGKPWEQTELFTDLYQRRFDKGESVRGEWTMRDLLSQYYTRVDGMFADLEKNGFRPNGGALPKFLIGRDGEVFIGNQGNHRLAMAVVLNIKIAGEILCRHQLA